MSIHVALTHRTSYKYDRAITLGPAMGDEVLVEEGLREGESVVIEGVDKLRDGLAVEPTSSRVTASAGAEEPAPKQP